MPIDNLDEYTDDESENIKVRPVLQREMSCAYYDGSLLSNVLADSEKLLLPGPYVHAVMPELQVFMSKNAVMEQLITTVDRIE